MPDKQVVEKETKTVATKKDMNEAKVEPQTVAAVRTSPPWPLITIGIFATVVILAVVIGGWSFIANNAQDSATTTPRMTNRLGMNYGSSNSSSGQSQYGGSGGYRRGGMSSLGSIAASGVITAINGDTIIVSGQGKQVTVTKSSSTMISGDETDIAVNDTVIVIGTTNNDGSVAATNIVVRNQSVGSGASSNSDAAPGA